MHLLRTGIMTSIVACTAFARPSDPQAARELLQLSAGAVENLQSLTAEIELGATGGFASWLPAGEGTLIVARAVRDRPGRAPAQPFEFRFTGKGKVTDKTAAREFDVVYRDRRYEWMNDDAKEQRIRYERIAGRDPEVRLAKSFLLDQVFTGEPYKAMLASDEIELSESKTIDGVLCEGVRVPVGKSGRYTIFYIPRTDFIPRRIEQGMDSPSAPISGTEFKELHHVQINVPLADSALEVPILTGYTPDPNPARVRPPTPMVRPNEVNPDAKPRKPLATPFELTSAQGEVVALSSLRGKVVVLDFWGTWMPESARAGMGVMQALSEKFEGKPVEVFGLDFRERDADKARAFFKDNGFTYNMLLDADGVARSYGVRQFPTMYIIGFEGEVVEVVNGFKSDSTLEHMSETIENYLADKAKEDAATTTPTTTPTTTVNPGG